MHEFLNPSAIRYTFRTYERLKREQHIDTLFRKGKAYSVFPLRILFLAVPRGAEASPVRAGFSVPKKKFKKSVHRQYIKRLMREAWRLGKHELYQALPEDHQIHLFFIFTDNVLPGYAAVAAAMGKGIERIAASVPRKTD